MEKTQTKDHGVQMEYSKISDYIYLGTNSCCQVHFDRTLLDQGVKADISLEAERIDAPWGVSYFLWLPTIDHTAPTLDALILGVQKIRFLVSRKIPVYVHCKNGHGRGPTLVVAYYLSLGMSLKKAIKEVSNKRKEIHIEPSQLEMLERFREEVQW